MFKEDDQIILTMSLSEVFTKDFRVDRLSGIVAKSR